MAVDNYALYTEVYANVGNVVVTRINTKEILLKIKATTIGLAPGRSVQEVTDTSSSGETIKTGEYIDGSKPKITLNFQGSNLDTVSMRQGYMPESKSTTVMLPQKIRVTKAEYQARSTGEYGYGVAADPAQAAGAVVGDNGATIQLTKQTYGSFNAATQNSFAVGADLAFKFSDDIVTAQKLVILEVPAVVSTRTIGETLVGAVSINALLKSNTGNTSVFTAPYCLISLGDTDGNANFGGGIQESSIVFDAIAAGSCKAWNINDLNLGLACFE